MKFISSKGTHKQRVIRSKSDNIKLTSCNNANKVVEELFDSLISRYQGNFERSMVGSGFIFDSLKIMYCKCNKVNFRRGV